MNKRIRILEDAINLIDETGERTEAYGSAQENFQRIADGWSILLDTHITSEQVALCMAWLKLARLVGPKPTDDGYIDAAAYVALAAELSVD